MMQRQPEPEYMDLPEEAAAYAEADFSEVNTAFVDRLIELVNLEDHVAALDVGTGPAEIPIRVLQRCPQWHITALDASQAMLDIGEQAINRAGLQERIRLTIGDAKTIPLPDRSFEVIFSNSILHHISEVQPFWSEIRRVARPGALLFLRDLARPADEAAARQLTETHAGGESELLKEEFYRSLLSAYTVEEVQEQLQAAGLNGLTVEMVTDRHLDVYGRINDE